MDKTKNDALCFKSSSNPLIDFYTCINRNINYFILEEYFNQSWKYDKLSTMKIIANSRDCRNGKGEKDISLFLLDLLKLVSKDNYQKNMDKYYRKYGCFKDVIKMIEMYIDNSELEFDYIIKTIKEDLENYNNNKNISLLAKWLPGETTKNKEIAKKIANKLFPYHKYPLKSYRKEVLVPLRKYLDIVETKMCSNRWSEIKYSQVPAKAMKIYNNAFTKHDNDRFDEYLIEVKNNKQKINSSGIQVYELVKYYLDNNKLNETIELQWKDILNKINNKGKLKNTIPVIDVSGSMDGLPIQVAMSLGLICSLLCEEPFYKKVIPFSQKAELVNIKGETLYDMVSNLNHIQWAMNTDIMSVFKMLLNTAKLYDIAPHQMPQQVIVFTDMQFDIANESNSDLEVTYNLIKEMYNQTIYQVPKLVFWNLSSEDNIPFPVECDTPNTAIVSGFSQNLLEIFMDIGEFTPEIILKNILNKYDDIELY